MASDSRSSSGLPLGLALPGWSPRSQPPRKILEGRFCRLEPLDVAKHGDDLVAAFSKTDPDSWRYLFAGPFASDDDCRNWLTDVASRTTEVPYALIDFKSGRAAGMASYMRIEPGHGVIEVGSIHYSDILKRTPATTEAMFLMMRHVFDDLGYRRYEWKCDSFNAPSRRTAQRLGFLFEGIFRQHMVVKGHSRDTAWFAIVGSDWPMLKHAYEKWLSPENFTDDGRQRVSLSDLIGATRGE
ncbi:GNAT family protein [Afipia sp. Root123D2]|uniref:GNAT family N-acetyltransferase n=1 Tax=Afipia sp. Root123D2 TaxID=1736436 RepID=UPI000AE70984|nr:GNAT family protein [Afipia sp. Root123D2]